MTKFEVGQPLPLPLFNPPGHEECRVSFNEAFIDIVYWVVGNDADAVRTLTNVKLEYGLYTSEDVVFFLVSFPTADWNFDVSLNIKKVQEDKVEDWLNSEANAINLYICDCNTNNLLGMRMIGIEMKAAEAIRDFLEKQNERYFNGVAVDLIINHLTQKLTTHDMIQRTKMYRL